MTVNETSNQKIMPRLKLLTMFRLGLYQMGLGMMSLLTLGVINRIMIDELKILPLIAAGAIAMHQFVAPARVWFGQMSDSQKIFGYHRTGYVWIGSALFTISSFLILQVVWQLGTSVQANGWSLPTYIWSLLLGVMFAFYGLALSASSTPFAAMLVDISDEDNRSKLIGIVWSMLMIGIVVGAIISSRLLNTAQICGTAILNKAELLVQSDKLVDISRLQTAINPVFMIVPSIVMALCFLATFGIEKKYSRYGVRSNLVEREDKITLGTAIKVLTASKQTGLFFTFLLVLTISLFMQDAVMEPYGGEVFGMCISDTTKLNAFFGMGTLIGISSTGFLILPRLGKQKTIQVGCIGAAFACILLILSGFTANSSLLQNSLFLFGLASGLLTAGATNLMLDLTAAETAGTFIGAWGLSQAMARGFSTVLGGAVLNLGKILFSNTVLAYGLVFTLEAIGMIVAIFLLRRINIQEFRSSAKQAISTVIQSELD
jgi:BCD family chlorophyll transporter-like MFS transporter